MARLTPKLLNSYPYSRYADTRTIQRGQDYFKEKRVWDVDLAQDGSMAVCLVEGNSAEYSVQIEVDQSSGQLYFDCTCPYAENNFCKHMIAAALRVSQLLQEQEEESIPVVLSGGSRSWQNKLNETLALVPPPSSRSFVRYIALVILRRSRIIPLTSIPLSRFLPKGKNGIS